MDVHFFERTYRMDRRITLDIPEGVLEKRQKRGWGVSMKVTGRKESKDRPRANQGHTVD